MWSRKKMPGFGQLSFLVSGLGLQADLRASFGFGETQVCPQPGSGCPRFARQPARLPHLLAQQRRCLACQTRYDKGEQDGRMFNQSSRGPRQTQLSVRTVDLAD